MAVIINAIDAHVLASPNLVVWLIKFNRGKFETI